MANPLWPITLPQSPLIASLSMQDQDSRLIFKPDVGPPLRRARYSATSRVFGFQMVLTQQQLAILDRFYNTTLGMGVLDFDWIDPSTNKVVTFSFNSPYQINNLMAVGIFGVAISLVRGASN